MMKIECTWRSGVLAVVMAVSLALAGCGGGGSGAPSSSGGIAPGALAGPSTVEISLNADSATGSTAASVSVAGSTIPSTDPSFLWPDEIQDPRPRIAHVYMEVVKVSLMPAEELFGNEDMDGDMIDANPPEPAFSADQPRFVTIIPDSPIRIDLLDRENGKRLARFLNRFDSVPAGTYDKIRVYYRRVKVVLSGNTSVNFHPTANSKFDIHFRQGHELVIPAATDTTQPDGWVKFFRVKINVVGLKLKIVSQGKSWKGCKVILRPQIFAESVSPVLYGVAGTATIRSKTQTLPISGTFNISFGTGPGYPRIILVTFDNNTTWAYSNDVLRDSGWIVDVMNTTAVPAFQDNATVLAIGLYDPSLLQAMDIVFSFPDVRQGIADNVWIRDNTAFIVRSELDNVVAIPLPDRGSAYYDNSTSPHLQLTYVAIDNNIPVTARGYLNGAGDLETYWISIGP
jgi:hypothetical protein